MRTGSTQASVLDPWWKRQAQAKGLDAVFRSVASSAYGSWLLGLLASGLVCCGMYCLLEAPLPRPDTGALRRCQGPVTADVGNSGSGLSFPPCRPAWRLSDEN
jgi:hypothetical protein